MTKRKGNCSEGKIEKSLIIIKPDAVRKKVVGEIISRFEKEGFLFEKMKMMQIDRDLATKHYSEHRGKDFFEHLLNYITSGRCVVMVVAREDAIKRAREIMGPTDSRKAAKGTIRGDFGEDVTINVIHGSDSVKSAEKEIKLFFG